MKTYRVNIKLENGDEVRAMAVGFNAKEARNSIVESNRFNEFARGMKIVSVTTRLVAATYPGKIEAARYDFQPSKEREGWYVVTDKKDLVIVIFEKGRFNETQRITRLDDTLPDPLAAASGLRAIADYLQQYHPEVL